MAQCSNCLGTGKVLNKNNEEETCPFCAGTGEQENQNDDPLIKDESDSGPLTIGLARLGLNDFDDILYPFLPL